jgi:2-hydroxychromene-2-carboxylate isomerase
MTAAVDLYFSFRSPYSYLATPGALQLEKDFDVEIALRPVLPLAIRMPAFFNPENLAKVHYILIDWERRAEMLGLPHKWPSPDPIVQDFDTWTIPEEQPYIYRLTWLGVEAEKRGRGIEYAAEVSRLIFGGTEGWDQGDHLAQAAARAGLDLSEMEAAIANPTSYIEQVANNQEQQAIAKHHGVPLFVYNDEPFFGQDRIDTLAWRLRQDGLATTPSAVS